jgi:hypothetical protein
MVDLVEALDPDVQSRVDHTVISRFMALSNLTTFVWIVLHPDECWDLVPALPDDTEQGGATSRTRRSKAKRPAREESEDEELQELRGRVRRRNDVLRRAWKEWWLVVVPKENRSSKEGIRLWLELLTQVCDGCSTPERRPFIDADRRSSIYLRSVRLSTRRRLRTRRSHP